ncbi:MAG: response regulator [Deltaproteobacteria bacterium]|nr:MAG: response regulator [Deltaproteobacteria bacterium]
MDRGSEFVVRLPVLREAIAEENVASPALGARAASLKKRVMVVDDNRDAAEMLAEALRIEGHDVSVAHDGLEALSLIDEREFDVSILDLGLPLMDGYELAQRIRQDGRCATTRLIAVTGYGQENDVARARAVGFDLHLVKPVELQAILQAVESLHRA